tara:strand:- start:1288 stop:1971 length:684 start_codon:yes stop_codon:yes gene_type:complete
MSSKRDEKKINFDNYADNYKDYITKSLGNLENNLNYYHLKKSEILKKELGYQPKKILDLGCGVGTMLELLIKSFQGSTFYAYDESKKSMDYIKKKFPKINHLDNLETNEKFDLIFISAVVHHVKSGDRDDLFRNIYNLLSPNGVMFVFEHNPYNPVTLKMVTNCEFDADAELIKKNDLINLCKKNNFKIIKSGYIHFFPSKLSFLFKLESYLKWFFLGAQYFCLFKK